MRGERWLFTIPLRLRSLFRRKQADQDLDDELRDHIEQKAEEYVARGLPLREARRQALLDMGGTEKRKEECRDARRVNWIQDLIQDIRYGLRVLRKSPGFAFIAILTLALGIGATTALFTVVRSVLLSPLPFDNPGRLVRLYEHSAEGHPHVDVAAGVYAEWRKQSTGFSSLAILSSPRWYSVSGAGGQLPESVLASEASASLFPTLSVEPVLGRNFATSDDARSANGTVVLSWGFWKRRFGGSASVLGQTIDLDARPYTIIGVMPSWFAYPSPTVQLWTPIYHEEDPQEMQAIDSHDFLAIGRLKPGVSEKQAAAQLSVIIRRLHDEHLDDPFVSIAANSRPLLDDMVGDIQAALYVLLAATSCLLFIGCLNVASLMVARGAARRRELAIRTALGGGRWRLFRQHVTETLLLSIAGGGAGIVIAFAVIRWFVGARPDMNRVESIHIDPWIVAFVFGVVFGCAFLASSLSSFSIDGGQILASLQESSRSQSAGHSRVRLRKVLLTIEVGLTTVLLVGSGLLLKSYERLRSSDLGCVTDNVLTMQFNLPETKYSQPAQRVNFFKALLERVRILPGVEAAGLVRMVPGWGYPGDSGFAIAEHPPLPRGKEQYAIVQWADPGYFAAVGIPFLRGQGFNESQEFGEAQDAIISDSFARRYFPGEDPIGKHLITLGKRSFEVVGVVGDTRYSPSQPAVPIMYFPLYGLLYGGVPADATLAVRASRNVAALGLPIQRIVQQLDPQLAVSDVLTMNQVIGKMTFDASFDATLMLAFGVLSLTLAAIGLFGVLFYVVTQRRQEMAIRVALGAQKNDVFQLVMGQGMFPVLAGLGIGIALAFGLMHLLANLLYGVEPTDPETLVTVSVILTTVALLASYIPARHAANVDPMVALRHE
jgi:predicted permease